MPASIRPAIWRSWTSAGARPDADRCPVSAGRLECPAPRAALTRRSVRSEHYRGEVQGRRRGNPARSVHDRRAGAGDEPGRPRPGLHAAARRAGDRHRGGDRLRRPAEPDPGVVRLRRRHRPAEPGHAPQEGGLAAPGAERHVLADEPGKHVAWRGTLPEQALSDATRRLLGDALTYQVLKDSHILVYPIPGPGGALTAGDRLVNFVWYVNVAEGQELEELMTGRDGIRRAVSLPPGAATDQPVTAMRQAAEAELAWPITAVVTGVGEPFVQVVYDIAVPRMAFGRACLIGDAAFAVRPHAAAGTAKAAADGWALAEALAAADGDVPTALASWERQQVALGRALLARCRDIGDSSQFHGTFRPGDQRLIFGLDGPGN